MTFVSKEISKKLIADLGITKPAYSENDGKFARLSCNSVNIEPVTPSEAVMAVEESEKAEKPMKSDEGGNPVFRMLSNAVVQRVYDFTELDFKKYVNLFSGVKLMRDHWYSIDNILGRVGEAYFDDSAEVSGVNAPIIIPKEFDDRNYSGRIKAGLIDSGSVGISFESKKSHDFEDPYDFYWLLGNTVEGSMVRFIVTKINKITEFSLVWEGADPNAKVVKNSASFESQIESMNGAIEIMTEELKKLKAENEALTPYKIGSEEKEATIAGLNAKLDDMKKQVEQLNQFHSVFSSFENAKLVNENLKTCLSILRADTKREMVASSNHSPVLEKIIDEMTSPNELFSLREDFKTKKLDRYKSGRVSVNTEDGENWQVSTTSKLNLNPVNKEAVK